MSNRWVPAPRQFPNKCFLTGLSSREHGPYLEIDSQKPFIDPVTHREGRMYWCFASWRGTVVDPDGPYAIVVEEAVHRRTVELQERIKHLEAVIATDPSRIALARFQEYMVDYQPVPAERQEVTVPPQPDDVPEQPRARKVVKK